MNFLSSVEAVITQIHLTSHAQVRVQQRGVDRTVLDCLFGMADESSTTAAANFSSV